MSDTINRLMEANLLSVFNERDAEVRAAILPDTYTADVRWTDDEGVVVGHDALNARAQHLHETQLVGMHFVAAGPVYQTTDFGYLAWHAVPDGSDQPVVSGFDVAVISDGLISQLWTVVTKVPE